MAKLCPASGKRKYHSEGDAYGWASNYLRRFNDSPKQLRAYLCPNCGMWHLTKSPITPCESSEATTMQLMRVISNDGQKAIVELIEANTIERDPNAKPEDFVAALKPGAVLEIPEV